MDKNKHLEDKEDLLKDCIGCKACTKDCSMLREYCSSPKELIENPMENKIPFSCNLCDKCEEVCPKDINIGKIFMKSRRKISKLNNGKSPFKAHRAVHFHQELGFSGFFSMSSGKTASKSVFLPGCSLSAYNPELVIETYRYLKTKNPDIGLILQCCGKPTESIGEEENFKKKYKLLEEMIDKTGATEVITACQSCYKLIKENSPNYKVTSLWTFIAEKGVPDIAKNIGSASDIIFSIQDSCPTRYDIEIQDSVRHIIKELGYKFQESELKGEKISCCGMGGMVMTVDKGLFKKIASNTANSLKHEHVITYCASCRDAMVLSDKKSIHILELIFNKELCFYGINKTWVNWMNRYRLKLMAKNEM
ncbi:MAG: (Fe-S)-binding protein [Solirubrobacterales bacterium]